MIPSVHGLHRDSLPTDFAAAHAIILAQREALVVAEAKAAAAESMAKSRALEIEQLKYQIAKLNHERYGQSSERSAVLEAGGLMNHGPNTVDMWRLIAVYLGRILKGEKPSDLPVMRPTKFEFIINLQTARLLRIEIPPTLLALVDAVIE